MSDILREYDTMIGILVAYDNQSRKQSLSSESAGVIEKIREILKKFVESE